MTVAMSEETNSEIDEKILALAQEKANGVTNKDIQAALGDIPATVWTKTINKFLKSG